MRFVDPQTGIVVPDMPKPQLGGPALIGGYFLSPQGMERLRQGQVIDNDPIVGAQTVVSQVDGTTLTITEFKQGRYEASWIYERATGKLVGARKRTQMPMGTGEMTFESRLVRS